MGKNYTLYINIDNFAKEENKSGLVNQLLAKYYAGQVFEVEPSGVNYTPNASFTVEEFKPLKPRPLTEVFKDAVPVSSQADEVPYPGYKIHRLTGQVVDTINEVPVDEVTKEMVDYLKKNNRYV